MFTQYLRNHVDPNRVINRTIALTLLFIFTYSLSYASIVFLPLYLKHTLHYTLQQTGVVLAVFGVGYILGAFFGGKLCDKFSPYKVAVLSLSGYLFTTLVIYFIRQPGWLVAIFLGMLGCAVATFSPAARIYLMNLTPSHERVRVNGIRYMLFNVGCAISFGIGGLITHSNYSNIFILSAASSIVTLMILLPLKGRVSMLAGTPEKTRVNLRVEKFLLVSLASFFLGTLVFNQIGSSYSLFLSLHYHLTSHLLGMLFVINALIIVFFQVSLINLVNKLPQFLVMSVGITILGVGFFILLFGRSFVVAVISMIIITLGEMLFMPVSYTLIFQHAREGAKGFYMGIYQALYAATFIVAPLLGAFALAHNPTGTFLWSTSLIICLLPLLCFLCLRKSGFIK